MFRSTQPRNEIIRVHAIVRPKRRRSVPIPVRQPPRQRRSRSRRRVRARTVFVSAPPPRSGTVYPTPTTPDAESAPDTPPTARPAPVAKPRDHRVLLVLLPAHVRHLGRFLSAPCKHGARVARPFARPEPRGVVVGRADEDVGERVKCQGPDVGVVGLGERCAREESGLERGRFGAGEVPVEDGAFGTAGDEDRVDGVPGDGWW